MTDIIERILALPPARQAEFAERLPPLSSQQEQFWLRQQIDPQSSLFNVQTTLRARGALQPERLREAALLVIRRHAVLRTGLLELNGAARQVVRDDARLEWTFVDCRAGDDPYQQALSLVQSCLTQPFDLARDPCLRLCVAQLGQDDHLIAVVAHHATLDAQAVRLVLGELLAAYAAPQGFLPDEAGALESALQYADFATWQRQTHEVEAAADIAWWKQQLAELPPPLDLPLDHTRTGSRGSSGRVSQRLEPALVAALDAVRKPAGASRFMVFIAIWAEILGRFGSTHDLCIGTPVSGRTRPELAGMIGNFVSDLPLLVRNSPSATFTQRLGEIRDVITGAFAHQAAPLARIAEAVGKRPGDLYQALINMVIVPAGADLGSVALGEMTLQPVDEIAPGAAMNDVALVVHDLPDGMVLHLDFDMALFSLETADRMLAALMQLLQRGVASPDQPLAQLSIMSEAEAATLGQFGRGERIAVPPDTVHQLIAAQCRRSPDRIAVIAGDQSLTYATLDRRANALAAILAAKGAGPERFVCTLMPESLDIVVIWLAIMKTGAAFVPLDLDAPPQRNLDLLAQFPDGLVLLGADLASSMGLPADRWLDVTDFADELGCFTPPPVHADHPIYAMFTSGSTGLPKGVVVTHRGIMNRLAWMSHHFAPECAERVLKTTRHLFDSAIWQIFWPLSRGGATVIIDATFPDGILPVLQTIQDQGITAVDFVPSTFSALIEELERDTARANIQLPSLKLAVFGGEQVTRDGVDWFHGHSQAAVYNLYGPTEASIGCIYRPLTRDYGGFIPIGKPIANTDVLLLDSMGQPVPIGVPGEICLVGECLARGYLDQPAATAKAFTPAPGGARLYRTGDLGRWSPAGDLIFIGRRDHQVKIRGYRVELGEIETVLLGHPDIGRAAVIADGQGNAAKRLYGFVVADAGRQADADAIRAYLQQRLADYMVPSRIMVLDELPLTANGKLDRRSLLIPDVEQSEPASNPPLAGVEADIARIICEVVGLTSIGRDDNYFDLGGDSIQAIRIASRAREAGWLLPASRIFATQTVAGMAQAAEPLAVAALPELRSESFALAPIQRRYMAGRDGPGRMCHTAVLDCGERWTAGEIEQALKAAVKAHPALGLRLHRQADGAWQQRYTSNDSEGWPTCGYSDLTELSGASQQELFRARVEALRENLDMINGPSVQAELFDRGAGWQQLVLIIHHLCIDALSWQILISTIERSLDQLRQDGAVFAAASDPSFQIHTERLLALSDDAGTIQRAAWWTADTWPTDLFKETTTSRSDDQTHLLHSITVSADQTEALVKRSHVTFGAQTGEVILSCVASAVGQTFSAEQFAITFESHGRDAINDLDVDRAVGWFTSVYPVLFTLPSGGDFLGSIGAVADRLRAVPDRGLPYGIGRYVRQDPDLLAIPEPQILFNYLGVLAVPKRSASGFGLAENVGSWRNLDQPAAKRAIDINCSIVDGRMGIHLVINDHLVPRKGAKALIAQIEANIAAAVTATEHGGIDQEAANVTDFDFLNVV